MNAMRREMLRLAAMRKLDGQTRQQRTRDQRTAEATERETVAERRARLLEWLDFCRNRPQFAEQERKLTESLGELPPVGSPEDAMTWGEFRTRSTP